MYISICYIIEPQIIHVNDESRITYVAFQECELRGGWTNPVVDFLISRGAEPDDFESKDPPNAERHKAVGTDCEVWLVRPDGLRRAWLFKRGHEIRIRGATIGFNQNSIVEELAVDEKTQQGR